MEIACEANLAGTVKDETAFSMSHAQTLGLCEMKLRDETQGYKLPPDTTP